ASAANMRTLIEDLLDFSRVSRKSQPLEPVDMRAVLDAAVSGLDLKIEEANASISFSGCFPTIQAVHSEMTQLFDNILSNAVKFRKRNLPSEVQVHGDKLSPAEVHALGLSGAQTYYRIAVADNGIGFEPEYAERIFQIFQRLNGKSEYPGSGIGLRSEEHTSELQSRE